MELNISLAPEALFYIGSWPISNSFFWFFWACLALIIAALILCANLKMIPDKIQNILEIVIGGAYDFTESIIGKGKKAQRVFPLVATMFIFILVCNLLTFIPGQAAVTLTRDGQSISVFRPIIADFGLVFMMTIIAALIVQIVAIITSGPFAYLGRFINFRNPFKFFLGIMELVSELARIISLSFRLFGNIFAGEVLGIVVLFLAPFFVPLPFMFLSLLVAVVQAFVFSVLTLVFISMASEVEEKTVQA